MGLYAQQVVPRIVNTCCGMKEITPLRARICAGLSGRVVEIGFGSGLNIPHYPATVAQVDGIEPADLGWKLAAKRLSASPVRIERAGLDGQSLPFADDTFDHAISTFTLCTIPDAAAALREVHRVLKPGGSLRFLEHGLAPDEKVRAMQRRLEPIQKRLFAGCHLTRDVPALVAGGGFAVGELEQLYLPGGPKFAGFFSLGTATAA